jgi:two-component system sensor histidine kinase DesK
MTTGTVTANTRTASARRIRSLGQAEARLRFSRDLHDVLGRNLSLVAVQSELAAELARRGQDGAAEQMLQVRQVAQESLREMRQVVDGYRTADLDSELAGARSVLRSAGVSVRVIGDGATLPGTVQAALGWVVREATTNVIRHSEATTCTISLDIVDGSPGGRTVVLRMENDGIRTHGSLPTTAGTGLLGLGERLAGLGGSVSSQVRTGGWFVVEARLPISKEIPTDIPDAIPTGLEPVP